MPEKLPKWTFTVTVQARRVVDDPLRTYLPTLVYWSAQLTPKVGLWLCNAVRRLLAAITGGEFTTASQEATQAYATLRKDAGKD